MGVHEELARLVGEAGRGVLDDADTLRAAIDDYLDEGAATRGEVNLLVDAVRLGTFRRLVAQLDNGADAGQAVQALGIELARDRGTRESASAAWALAALGYAVGEVADEQVLALREQVVPEADPARPAPPQRPAPESAMPPAGISTVRRPGTVPMDDAAPAAGDAPRRSVRALLAVAAVVALVAAGVAVAATWDRGDDDRPDADTTGTPTSTEPFETLAIDGGSQRFKGVRSARTYRLSTRRVSSAVELTNTTRRPMTVLWTEVVPKELAEHVSQVEFQPADRQVIEADPIVYWRLRLPAGGSRSVRWTTPLPEGAVASADYLARITGWHEEAITAALPRIREDVPKLRRPGEVALTPDVPEPDLPADVPSVPVVEESDAAVPDEPVASPDQPTPRPSATRQANRAPRLSLVSKSTSERVAASYTVNASDPDGDSWSVVAVSGLPAGIGRSGRTLSGTVSHAAAGVTSSRSNIRSRSFTVRVTVRDSRGAQTSGSFTWTVRDTHLAMPNYIGKYGNSPDIGTLFVPNFTGCLDTGRPVDTIARQSVGAGTAVAWGSSPRFTYVHHSGSYPAC